MTLSTGSGRNSGAGTHSGMDSDMVAGTGVTLKLTMGYDMGWKPGREAVQA